jgi:hypothetical protein
LSAVEWCLASDATNGAYVSAAAVYHDQGSAISLGASDATDRSTAGCYTLTVPSLSPRGYSFALALAGQTTNLTQVGLVIQNVRATWMPAGPALISAADIAPSDALVVEDLDALAEEMLTDA